MEQRRVGGECEGSGGVRGRLWSEWAALYVGSKVSKTRDEVESVGQEPQVEEQRRRRQGPLGGR